MDDPLDVLAVRVLGSLIEKQVTTPDNYPLTINALVAACNQTSNRDPILEVNATTVSECLKDLTRRSLAREVHRSDARAKRYRHQMEESMHLHPPELAVMCVLMLRGPQTAGEIRTRTTRLFEFTDLAHVDVTLQALATLAMPLVAELPLQPGQKEARYAHLLSGIPEAETSEAPTTHPVAVDRVAALEQAVDSLRSDLAGLRTRFEEFKRQFQ